MRSQHPAAVYRRWRSIRTAATLIVLLGILAGAAWFGWQEVLGESTPSTKLVCSTPAPGTTQEVEASDVTVNVYNAGRTTGLAGDTSKQLEARGFAIEDVANASEDASVARAQVRGRAEDAPEVQLLAAQVGDDVDIAVDDRGEAIVDLVVGDEFEGLVEDAPTSMEVESTVPICTTTTPTPEPQD